MLTNKTIVLGVTGGDRPPTRRRSGQPACQARMPGIHVLMTRSATEFIAPLTFETLTGQQGGGGHL